MAHITLPSSEVYKDIEATVHNQPARFADNAIPVLLDAMHKCGADVENMRAAISGGAQFRRTPKSARSLPELFTIGSKTTKSVCDILDTLKIPILAKQVGGSRGRTVLFRVCDGCVIVKESASEAKLIAMLNTPIVEKAA
jgi:chemotaxis protein CheD